jgi:signal transduction histidine kinase
MRATLGQLRQGTPGGDPQASAGGLDRLPALRDAVTAAGAPVTVEVSGEQRPLPPDVDKAAYRILQESLTNVLRHAGQTAHATVWLSFEPGALAIRVRDDGGEQAGAAAGTAGADGATGGHGLTGMVERAAAVGGQVTAGPRAEGGFEVTARLPLGGGGQTA